MQAADGCGSAAGMAESTLGASTGRVREFALSATNTTMPPAMTQAVRLARKRHAPRTMVARLRC